MRLDGGGRLMIRRRLSADGMVSWACVSGRWF